jgi:hypothetical protein
VNRNRLATVVALTCLAASSPARAQYDEMMNVDEDSQIGSPERVTLTLNIGAYQPNVGNAAFDIVYQGEKGPYVGGEVHGLIYRIPYVGPIGAGVGIAWARYEAPACVDPPMNCVDRTDDTDEMSLWPLTAMVSLRIDVLARELNVPLVFTPKLGLDVILFRNELSGSTLASGASIGLRWAVEMALELDFLERRAARALDEEWGINHSFLFFQLFGSTAGGDVPMGDSLAWTAGLGFVL